MKYNSLKVFWSILGLGTFLMITPTFIAAEENTDSTNPLSIDIDVLSEDSENAEILDVDINNLLGIENIDVKIPNSEENTEEIGSITINDEERVRIETDILTETETQVADEQAVVDVVVEELLGTEEVEVEVLKQDEIQSNGSHSSESAVADVTAKELLGTEEVEVEVLKQDENQSNGSHSSESAVVDVEAKELLGTEEVEVEVLKQKENQWNDSHSSGSAVADVEAKELLGTEEVNIEVLAQDERTSANASFYTEAVVQATIDNLAISDQIELNLLKKEKSIQDHNQMQEQQVVHLGLNDLPILDKLHLGFLENKTTKEKTNSLEDTALFTVGFGDESSTTKDSLLDEVKLGVLEKSRSSSEKSQAEKSAIVGLEISDTSLGDFATYVLLSKLTKDNGNIRNNSGLIEVNSDNLALLEDVHIGVLDRHEKANGQNSSSFSEGAIQLDIMPDFMDKISADVLSNESSATSDRIYRNSRAIAIGLIGDDILEGVDIEILPTESIIEGAPINPLLPVEDVGEVAEGNKSGDTEDNVVVPGIEENNNDKGIEEDASVINEDEKTTVEQNPSPDEEIIVAEGEISDSKDRRTETTPSLQVNDESLTEEEDGAGIGANFNSSDGNFFNGPSLPQTGGFFTGVMLLFIALSLLGSGWAIRRLA